MGRICLIGSLLILSVFQLSAQTGGTSNLEFVENKGQWDTAVKFRAEMTTGAFFLGKKGFTVLLHDTSDLRMVQAMRHGTARNLLPAGKTNGKVVGRTVLQGGNSSSPGVITAANALLHSHIYRVSFDGANENVEITPDKALPTYNNYFIGDDRSKWATDCKIYQGIIYKNIYAGIDLHYYTDAGTLKYDLIVHPGADPDQITLKYEGQDQLSVKKNQLFVKTSVGVVKEWIPRSYQISEIEKKDLECNYILSEGNKVKLKVKNYSHDATLIIDPTEVFCSFTGSTSDNWGYTATYDGSGNFYAGGIVLADGAGDPSGNGFKTLGGYQSSYQGGDQSEGGFEYDVAIMKLSSNGSTRLYATYLGGNGDEQPHSMVVDNSGNLIVAGRTSSRNFPRTRTNFGRGDSVGTFDIFLTKFTAAGNGLIGSLRIGGSGDDGVNYSPKYVSTNGTQHLRLNYGDDGRSEVIIDNNNNIYLASCTQSSDFPVTPGAFQPTSGGGQDGVLIKISPDLSTILFSSYLGGNQDDAAFVLAINPGNSNIYVGGGTMSTDLKGTGNGTVLGPTSSGGVHGFVSIVSNDGSTLVKSSYFKAAEASSTDIIYGLEIDRNGFPYITGTTTGTWPVVNAAWSQPGGKQFISKLKPDLSNWVYSTVFGKAKSPYPDLSITAFLVDRCENVYVAGWGGGIDVSEHYNNSGTNGLLPTSNAIKSTTDGADFYFFVLRRDAISQLYGSFFGQVNGALGDHVDGGTSRFDRNGVIYEAICANCYGGAKFPTTLNVWASSNGTTLGGRVLGCNEAAVKIAFNFAGVGGGVKAALSGRGDSLGCVPLNAFLQDTIRDAKSYIWDFGDGSPTVTTTSYKENHIYTVVGKYRVMLIAIDSSSCNISDTVYMNITARNDRAPLAFNYNKIGGCTSLDFDFHNLSTFPGTKSFGPKSFIWNFGDNSPTVNTGVGDVNHSFASAGTYQVSLILVDTNYCNYPDTLTKQLGIAQNVKAQFVTPATGCAPYQAYIDNTSIAGQQYYWDFGDGTVDTTDRTPPPHLYPDTGTYTIKLRVVDSSTCNITDATQFTITLIGKPTSALNYAPKQPVPNSPVIFTNQASPDAVQFKWLFGDGKSESTNTRDTAIHQYNSTNTAGWNACLVAINPNGCPDTACQLVPTIVNPLLDVPNAFTPGRFGENGIIKVVGFGITHMIFRVYNRWGQLMFESDDPAIGWDGTFKGVIQPMDVYAYTLEANYSDGTQTNKKGNITLIR